MKYIKKFAAVLLAAMLVSAVFAGCSNQNAQTDEITEDTMLIAYTEENAPFIYTDGNGALTGFDVEVIQNIFESFKGEYKDYKFVKVDEGYVLNETPCYTDSNGNEYSAIIMCGGTQKDTGTVNKDVHWSQNIIENNIIAVVPSGSSVKSFADISGLKAGVVSSAAAAALDENAAVKNSLASVTVYNSEDEAFKALESKAADVIITDDFSFYNCKGYEKYTVLPSVLGTVKYAFEFAPSKDFSEGFNEAVKEMISPDYGDGDTLTPIVEKYFGYGGACVFTVDDVEK